MARLAGLVPDQSLGARRRPGDSAGNSMPVGAPNPKSRSVVYCSAGASRVLNLTMAMLLDTRIAPASVKDGSGSSSVTGVGRRSAAVLDAGGRDPRESNIAMVKFSTRL